MIQKLSSSANKTNPVYFTFKVQSFNKHKRSRVPRLVALQQCFFQAYHSTCQFWDCRLTIRCCC